MPGTRQEHSYRLLKGWTQRAAGVSLCLPRPRLFASQPLTEWGWLSSFTLTWTIIPHLPQFSLKLIMYLQSMNSPTWKSNYINFPFLLRFLFLQPTVQNTTFHLTGTHLLYGFPVHLVNDVLYVLQISIMPSQPLLRPCPQFYKNRRFQYLGTQTHQILSLNLKTRLSRTAAKRAVHTQP